MDALPTDLRSLEVEVARGSYGTLEQRIATEPDLIGRRYQKTGRERGSAGKRSKAPFFRIKRSQSGAFTGY